jgi:hypothetical protein
VAAVTTGAARAEQPSRALWVWDTVPLLTDLSERQRFLEFCRLQSIDTAWLQVARPAAGGRLEHEDEWRSLLHDAHRREVRIHALDGDPAYVRREAHATVLDLVDTIIRFNRAAPDGERFAGIHLDNEPHLLPGWQVPAVREALIAEFLELNARVHRVVRAESGLEFGVDIPFWWPRPEIFNHVDNVAIMDYRNVASGDDGIIALARPLLEYGNATSAKVFVGVETSPVAHVELPKLTFAGRSNAEMDRELALAHAALARNRSYAGLAIHHYAPYRERFR